MYINFTHDNIILIADACSSKLSNSFSVQIETIIATVHYNIILLWIAIEQRKGGLGPLLSLVNGIPYLCVITFIPFQIGVLYYVTCTCIDCVHVSLAWLFLENCKVWGEGIRWFSGLMIVLPKYLCAG